MATFTDLLNVLPDPNYKRGIAGQELTTGSTGPGFASIKLTNDQKMMLTRTNSQAAIARSVAGQKWNIDISYHPMTRAEFEPVYAFLLQQKGPLTSFFVSLPQYRVSRNTAWDTNFVTKTFTHSGSATPAYTFTVPSSSGGGTAGTDVLMVNVAKHDQYGVAYSNQNDTTNATVPFPGDMITINDSSNSNHKKAYLITSVETKDTHQTGETLVPDSTHKQIKLRVSPPFVKTVAGNSTVVFSKPLVKVIQPKPMAEYALNTDNLYSFKLKLEEFI